MKNKLIDGTSTYEDYQNKMKEELGEDIYFYETDNVADSLSSLFSSLQEIRGRSDAEVISDLIENKGKGGLMYYEPGLE